MNRQAELERLLEELAEDFAELTEKQQQKLADNIRKTLSSSMADLLAKYAESDGTIKRQKITQVLRDLQTIEDEVRTQMLAEIEAIIEESASFAIDNRNEIFLTVLGVALIALASERKAIAGAVTKRVMRQQGDDLLTLSDRVWNLAGDMRAELTKVVRADILKAEAVSTMIRNVRAVHDNETWKIRRLVVNESNVSYRKATGESAHKSEVVTAIKLNDNGFRHRNHREHECHKLANADDYGLGRGIYPTSERSRLEQPHTQCSSYITDVINERYLNGE